MCLEQPTLLPFHSAVGCVKILVLHSAVCQELRRTLVSDCCFGAGEHPVFTCSIPSKCILTAVRHKESQSLPTPTCELPHQCAWNNPLYSLSTPLVVCGKQINHYPAQRERA